MTASPYVYLLIHTPSRRLYIGSRVPKGETNDLWCGYFSSSKVVGELPRGEFVPVVLSEHSTAREAREEEARLHDLYQVHRDGRFLNRATAHPKFCGGGDPWNKGKKMSPAQVEKMRGRKLSEEHKRNLSKAKQGENHPNYGKHLSEETRRKIGEANQKTHCPKGHPYAGENLRLTKEGWKVCRECSRAESAARYRARRRG